MSVDLRTRSDADVAPVDPIDLFEHVLPRSFEARPHVAQAAGRRPLRPLLLEVEGRRWTLRSVDDDTKVVVEAGDTAADAPRRAHVRLRADQVSDLATDQVTPIGLLTAGDLDQPRRHPDGGPRPHRPGGQPGRSPLQADRDHVEHLRRPVAQGLQPRPPQLRVLQPDRRRVRHRCGARVGPAARDRRLAPGPRVALAPRHRRARAARRVPRHGGRRRHGPPQLHAAPRRTADRTRATSAVHRIPPATTQRRCHAPRPATPDADRPRAGAAHHRPAGIRHRRAGGVTPSPP